MSTPCANPNASNCSEEIALTAMPTSWMDYSRFFAVTMTSSSPCALTGVVDAVTVRPAITQACRELLLSRLLIWFSPDQINQNCPVADLAIPVARHRTVRDVRGRILA
jgi:hypothetical protein